MPMETFSADVLKKLQRNMDTRLHSTLQHEVKILRNGDIGTNIKEVCAGAFQAFVKVVEGEEVVST